MDPLKQAQFLALLMLLAPLAAAVDQADWEGPEQIPLGGLNPSNSTIDGFSLPTNATVTNAEFELSPSWTQAEDNGTYWAGDFQNGFSSGVFNGTTALGQDSNLRLATNSTFGAMTDFETTIEQFSSWIVNGDDVWQPVNLSSVSYGPNNAVDGIIVAGSNGSISPGSFSTLNSKFWQIPAVVNNLNVNFSHWESFDQDDLLSFEFSHDGGMNWLELDNWSGENNQWQNESYNLDSYINSTSVGLGFRFVTNTSENSGADVGAFIDEFEISNEGESRGAWFFGNASGQYSANADGSLIIPVDLSGLQFPLELVYWANWDIEGSTNDNMNIWLTLDNGSNWQILTAHPGVPGHGITYNGAVYTQISTKWIEVRTPLPSWTSTHNNASHAQLRFQVQTDGVKNFGGGSIDLWEGIIIDDLSIETQAGSTNSSLWTFTNMTNTSGHVLQNVTGFANDWQHITWEGNNGPWSISDSFESTQNLPRGWKINHEDGATTWELGEIDTWNSAGPSSGNWPSGSNGVAINLDGRYSNNVFTHLVSPSYMIPVGSTARLTFKHWICTEPAWDGGAIYTSIDNGFTWQYFGDNISGFYERLSQVNTFSPFHGKGIFDGSTVNNGCGNNNTAHLFTTKSGDISYLAGNEVKFRFSFFSDTFVIDDGWYIDDAGIEIDKFIPNGNWTSPLIEADEAGWGRIEAVASVPQSTSLSADVFDENGNTISGYENVTLPIDLSIGTWEYQKIGVRVYLWSSDEDYTPVVQKIRHGGWANLIAELLYEAELNSQISIEEDGTIRNTGPTPVDMSITADLWRPTKHLQYYCDGDGSLSLPNNINYWNNQPWQSVINCNLNDLNLSAPVTEIQIDIQLNPGQWIKNFQISPIGLRSPTNVSLDIGNNGNIDWHGDGNLFHHTTIDSLSVDGQNLPVTEVSNGFSINVNNSIEFMIIMLQTYDSNNYVSWSQAIEFSGDFQEHYTLINHSKTIDGIMHNLVAISFEYTTSSPNTFKLIEIDLLSHGDLRFNLDKTYVQSMMTDDPEGGSVIPVTFVSQRGTILFDGIIEHDLAITDEWITLPSQTFIPDSFHQAISRHKTLPFTPELQSIELIIAPTTDSTESPLAHIEVDNLEQGGRFIQHYGAGTISIDPSNSSWDGENVTWGVETHWYLDDYSRLYWFVKATNVEGVALGPAVESTGSGTHSASTNDAEVVGFRVLDNSRDLGDFSDPLWPFKVRASTTLNVSGEVRYSGLEGINPNPNDIELKVSLLHGNSTLNTLNLSIDEDGLFSGVIITPDDNILSGELLSIRSDIIRIGPSEIATSLDTTSELHAVDFVLDANNGNIIDLWVVAPGGIQPADGHVWHPGQDLPLRLSVSDDNGLPPIMKMHYTAGGNGWNTITFQTPIGQINATIDLPLIDDAEMQISGQPTGIAEVYISGNDLAGNDFIGGGSAQQPLATILLQERIDTYVNPNSLQLNQESGYLLPGNTHRFTFEISDGNGLESIDEIKFGLSENVCEISWKPWSETISHDQSCFIKSPRIEVLQVGNVDTWWIDVDFELRWDINPEWQDTWQTPWLHIIDESTRTGAGFNSMTPFNWKYHTGIQLQIDSISDNTMPKGKLVDGVVYIHSQDIIDIEMVVYHLGMNIPAHNLPFSAGIDIDLIGGDDEQGFIERINSDGSASLRVVYDESRYGAQARLQAVIIDLSGHTIIEDSVDIVVDNSPPILSVDMTSLANLQSDNLDQVRIDLTIHDSHGLDNESIVMNYAYMRKGRILEGTMSNTTIELSFVGDKYNIYSSQVDISPPSGVLAKEDIVLIWFEGEDASGRDLTGLGSSQVEPILISIMWMEYEPELGQIISDPYRPKVGDIVDISLNIVNNGKYSGNSTVFIRDREGISHGIQNISLEPNQIISLKFEVEAWTFGDLGLEVIIDNEEGIPVPLADVTSPEEQSGMLEDKMIGIAFLCLLFSTLILLVVRNKKQNQFNFHEEE
ncbi:MAG: hypothetical protein QGI21_03835 [Candidatus Poseidoniaceae archaeon]|nr:hypothetical protein [Candidatus Poseidoniaceae archaeon]